MAAAKAGGGERVPESPRASNMWVAGHPLARQLLPGAGMAAPHRPPLEAECHCPLHKGKGREGLTLWPWAAKQQEVGRA